MRIVDAHVHFWDPAELDYPWLAALPSIRRAFRPSDYAAAAREVGGSLPQVVFVEANCRPEQARREVQRVERMVREGEEDLCVAGIVAFADLTQGSGAGGWGLEQTLDGLSRSPKVKGIRHNIQGQPAGFCLQPAFVLGVQTVGRRGLTFDLCATSRIWCVNVPTRASCSTIAANRPSGRDGWSRGARTWRVSPPTRTCAASCPGC